MTGLFVIDENICQVVVIEKIEVTSLFLILILIQNVFSFSEIISKKEKYTNDQPVQFQDVY